MKKAIILYVLIFTFVTLSQSAYAKYSLEWNKNIELQANTLYSVCFGNNLFVTVGDDGSIKTSSDGYNWLTVDAGIISCLFDVIYLENMFIAVGQAGTIITSFDGISWTKVKTDIKTDILDIEWKDNQYISFTRKGIIGSSNLEIWKEMYMNLEKSPHIAYGNNKYVGVQSDGKLESSDIGLYAQTIEVDANINDVTFGNGVFIAVGFAGAILASEDGNHWEAKVDITKCDFDDVIWHDNHFIAVGWNGNSSIMTSKDGQEWIKRDCETNSLSWLAWDGKKYVALGAGGTILTSTDGITWQLHNMDEPVLYKSIIWDGEKFVAVGMYGKISTSLDGLNWIKRDSGIEDHLDSIAWNGKLFVAVGDKHILTSTDGINWKMSFSIRNKESEFTSIIWGGNQFVAGGLGIVMISPDGINWSPSEMGTEVGFIDLTWTGDMYIAVSSFGMIFTSQNGSKWTRSFAPTNIPLRNITWNGSHLVVATDNSTILTSIPKDTIKVKVNGKPIIFDIAPIIKEGRTLVPLRYIFEALGAEVKWDAQSRTVEGIKGSNKILLKTDSKDSIVNGEPKKLDVVATILNGRTLVPARFISESLGCKVIWDNDSRTVIISSY